VVAADPAAGARAGSVLHVPPPRNLGRQQGGKGKTERRGESDGRAEAKPTPQESKNLGWIFVKRKVDFDLISCQNTSNGSFRMGGDFFQQTSTFARI